MSDITKLNQVNISTVGDATSTVLNNSQIVSEVLKQNQGNTEVVK